MPKTSAREWLIVNKWYSPEDTDELDAAADACEAYASRSLSEEAIQKAAEKIVGGSSGFKSYNKPFDIAKIAETLRSEFVPPDTARWIPASEKLPDVVGGDCASMNVLVMCDFPGYPLGYNNKVLVGFVDYGDDVPTWTVRGYGDQHLTVTHWMPLPVPPDKGASTKENV